MNYNFADLGQVLDIISLSTKYDSKNIEKFIALLKDRQATEQFIVVLEEYNRLLSMIQKGGKNKKDKANAPIDISELEDAPSPLISQICKILKNKQYYSTSSSLNEFVGQAFPNHYAEFSSNNDSYEVKLMHIRSLLSEKSVDQLRKILRSIQPKVNQQDSSSNDLSPWGDIIMNRNKDDGTP